MSRHCSDYCRFAQHCRVKDSSTIHDTAPEDLIRLCPEWVRLEDLAWDAECSLEIPFTDEFDGCEEDDDYDP